MSVAKYGQEGAVGKTAFNKDKFPCQSPLFSSSFILIYVYDIIIHSFLVKIISYYFIIFK